MEELNPVYHSPIIFYMAINIYCWGYEYEKLPNSTFDSI